MTGRAVPKCLAGNRQASTSTDFKAGACLNKAKQLTNVIVQHALATQAENGAGFHPMGPGSAMNTEFTETIAMEG